MPVTERRLCRDGCHVENFTSHLLGIVARQWLQLRSFRFALASYAHLISSTFLRGIKRVVGRAPRCPGVGEVNDVSDGGKEGDLTEWLVGLAIYQPTLRWTFPDHHRDHPEYSANARASAWVAAA